jgi:alkanesulfonate monooxygenase SsuD/methylene tetrahydromethanopterin reductase-like flavin-dependent oxidoreductase (luciferase family)
VTCNGYRNPALLAKIASTTDVMSHGRLICGLGAGWYEHEWRAYGYGFPDVPERMGAFREACEIIHKMWTEDKPVFKGKYYTIDGPINEPKGARKPHPEFWLGGGGEKVTLKLVARYADACNIGGGVDSVRRKEAILQEHCRAVGRDHREIERTTIVGAVVIRDSRAEAQRVFEKLFESNGRAQPWTSQPVGTPDEVAAVIRPYLEIGPGYRHLLAGFPAPYDEESMTRFAAEVRPRLERS